MPTHTQYHKSPLALTIQCLYVVSVWVFLSPLLQCDWLTALTRVLCLCVFRFVILCSSYWRNHSSSPFLLTLTKKNFILVFESFWWKWKIKVYQTKAWFKSGSRTRTPYCHKFPLTFNMASIPFFFVTFHHHLFIFFCFAVCFCFCSSSVSTITCNWLITLK